MRRLTRDHLELLTQLAQGSSLKSHRDLDGAKVYRLHLLDGTKQIPSEKIIADLKQQRYIDSNKKFPAATYLLTEKGRKAAASILDEEVVALSARNYSG